LSENRIIKKDENFSEWYVKAINDAEILDQRYPVKGFPVYRSWGFKALRKCFRILEELLEEDGVMPVLFPIVIPEDFLEKESEHIRGFQDEVFWVTHGGREELSKKLALRPTSETAMYPIFAYWIRSYKDLPLKVYQTCTVYRYETKHTRMLIRGREVFWNEAHTAHATWEDAYEHILKTKELYSRFFDKFDIPYIVLRRPEWDKFAGADMTIAFETIMPDGRSLQIGTIHHLGENFSRAFDIKYLGEDQENHYVSQTSYGISMRVLGAIIGIHGDDVGIVFPPEIAPIKVVIIPIPTNDEKINDGIFKTCKKLKEDISSKTDWEVLMDDREDTPGNKYYFWERKGVPLRIEIGKREVEGNFVTIVRRDEKKRKKVNFEDIIDSISSEFKEMHKALRERAYKKFNSMISEARTLDELREILSTKGGFVKVPFCSVDKDGMECAEVLKDYGISVGGVKFPDPDEAEDGSKCIVCGKKANYKVWVSRPY